jgi:hypothetical protein
MKLRNPELYDLHIVVVMISTILTSSENVFETVGHKDWVHSFGGGISSKAPI